MKGNADMRHRYLLVALTVFVPALTGCSANQTPAIQGPGVQSRSHAVTQTGTGRYKIGKHTLVEADVADNIVNVYDISEKQLKRNPAPIASISDSLDQPYGVALDSSGDLYVANYGNSTVTVYPRGGTKHSSTITTGLSKPLFIAINSDTLYVANNGNGTVTTYSTGSDSPSQTITGFSSPFGITLDKNGNVYVTDPGVTDVWEVPNGSSTPRRLNLQDLHQPNDLAVDSKGNLWVTDSYYFPGQIFIYPPGATTPSRVIEGRFVAYPYGIAIEAGAKGSVYVASLLQRVDAFKQNAYAPYAELSNGVGTPTGVFITQ
jgi:sugar lactone lactonase YvrE